MSRQLPTLDLRKKEVRAGDFKTAIWTQYLNCVNSLNTLESESIGYQDLNKFDSNPSWEKFGGNVDILETMMYGASLLGDTPQCPFDEWKDYLKRFGELTKTLKEKVFAELTEDGGHV